RLDHRDGDCARDRGIDRVAALGQHAQARRCREMLRGGDDIGGEDRQLLGAVGKIVIDRRHPEGPFYFFLVAASASMRATKRGTWRNWRLSASLLPNSAERSNRPAPAISPSRPDSVNRPVSRKVFSAATAWS